MEKITYESTNAMTGQIDKVTVEGDFVHINDLFFALKRLCLGIGFHADNVNECFQDCENWGKVGSVNDVEVSQAYINDLMGKTKQE